MPELMPRPGEPIVDKPGFSSFYATDLERLLTARGIRHMMVCGVTTDVCVHSTVRDATERGYEPLLIEDCCAATIPANHLAAIETIRSEGGIFCATTTYGAVIATLRTLQDQVRDEGKLRPLAIA